MLNTFKNQYLHIDGLRIRIGVRKAGKDSQSTLPILACNGLGANMELWEPFIKCLEGLEIVAFDAPGIGESDIPNLPLRYSSLARICVRIMDELGYQEFDVMGVSWGGGIAQEIARRYQNRCKRLILAATGPGAIMKYGNLSVLLSMANPNRYANREIMRAMAPKLYGGIFRTDQNTINELAEIIKPPKDLGYYFQILSGWGWTSIHWLHTLKQPTLILAGKDDPIIPPINAHIMKCLIPNARVEELDCGHLFTYTRTNETAVLITDFLATAH